MVVWGFQVGKVFLMEDYIRMMDVSMKYKMEFHAIR